MSFTRYEQETTTIRNAGDEYTVIESWYPKDVRAMEKDPRFHRIDGGVLDNSVWGRFRIRSADWSPVSGAKRRRNLTDEQRAAIGRRLSKSRSAQGAV